MIALWFLAESLWLLFKKCFLQEKFAGGSFTTTVEAYVPVNGRGIQVSKFWLIPPLLYFLSVICICQYWLRLRNKLFVQFWVRLFARWFRVPLLITLGKTSRKCLTSRSRIQRKAENNLPSRTHGDSPRGLFSPIIKDPILCAYRYFASCIMHFLYIQNEFLILVFLTLSIANVTWKHRVAFFVRNLTYSDPEK